MLIKTENIARVLYVRQTLPTFGFDTGSAQNVFQGVVLKEIKTKTKLCKTVVDGYRSALIARALAYLQHQFV